MFRGGVVGAVAILVVSLHGCQGARPFRTVATYELPVARCLVTIEASGTVPAGHDLADEGTGSLSVVPAAGGSGSSTQVALRQGRVVLDALDVAALVTRGACPANAAETEELGRAIEGALMGPKATMMAGQTRNLRVVSVVLAR
jgi:hypothetical protein